MKLTKPFTHYFTLFLIVILITALASACDTNTTPSNQETTEPPVDQTEEVTQPPADVLPPTEPPPTEPPATEPPATEPPPDSPTIPDTPLSSSGPWIVYAGGMSIYALNPDGSGLTPLFDYGDGGWYEVTQPWAAPQGGRVALLLVDSTSKFTIPHILIIKLPSGVIEADISLLPEDWDYESLSEDEKGYARKLFAAVGPVNNLAWSNDGTMLAFNAAIEGPTSDLYIYNTSDKSILRLTSGSTTSIDPFFTATDSHIVHGAITNLSYTNDYYGPSYNFQHVWAAKSDGSGNIKVFEHDFAGHENFLGWISDTTYLGESWEDECESFNLRKIDINRGELDILYEGHYEEKAFALSHNKFLFVVPSYFLYPECTAVDQPGLYILDTATGIHTPIPEIDWVAINTITWHEQSELFFVVTNLGPMYAISPSGSISEYQSPTSLYDPPIFNQDGTKWAFVDSVTDTFVIGGLNGEYIELNMEKPHNAIWSPDSQWLLFIAYYKEKTSFYAAPAPNYDPIVIESGFLDIFYGEPPVIVNP